MTINKQDSHSRTSLSDSNFRKASTTRATAGRDTIMGSKTCHLEAAPHFAAPISIPPKMESASTRWQPHSMLAQSQLQLAERAMRGELRTASSVANFHQKQKPRYLFGSARGVEAAACWLMMVPFFTALMTFEKL